MRNYRRMKEYTNASTWYKHNEGVSELARYIAETLDWEIPGGLIGEMASFSDSDDKPSIEENGNKTVVDMYLFAPYTMPYTTGYGFGSEIVQNDYDLSIEEFVKKAEKEKIPEESNEWGEALIEYFIDDWVDMGIIFTIEEYDDGVDVEYSLIENNYTVDSNKMFISDEDLKSKEYEEKISSIIVGLYEKA